MVPNDKIKGYSHPPSSEAPIDYVFLFVHGASFSSKLFDTNLKEFLESLAQVNYDWFWELNLNYHVEMIDWKSCLSPYQFRNISRCMPVESIFDDDDEDEAQREAEECAGRESASEPGPAQRQESFARQFMNKIFGKPNAKEEEEEDGTKEPEAPPLIHAGAGTVKIAETQAIGVGSREELNFTTLGSSVETEPEDGSPEFWEFHDNPSSQGEDNSEEESKEPAKVKYRTDSDLKVEPENVKEFRDLQRKHGLRVYFSNTVVDVMFYLTPRYGGYMSTQVGHLLNQRVSDLRNSPCGRFKNSEIILVGHSLGSIILYELLSGKPLRSTLFDETDLEEDCIFPDQGLPDIKDCLESQARPNGFLNFKVPHVFLWGSPLSSFLVLKNDKSFAPNGPLSINNPNLRLYNIFHRSDPIATRVEPIYYKHQTNTPPAVQIANYHQGDMLRRGIELATKSSVKKAATMFMSRLFSGAAGIPPETETWANKLAGEFRYTLPDPLSRKKRFGVLDPDVYATPNSNSDGQRQDRRSSRLSRRESLALQHMIDSQDYTGGRVRAPVESPRDSPTTTARAHPADDSTSRRRDNRFSLNGGELLTSRAGQTHEEKIWHKPWTPRQLALNIVRKLRKKHSQEIEEKSITDLSVKRRLYELIDYEFDQFYHAVCSTGINKVPRLDYEAEVQNEEQWLRKAHKRDLELTMNQLRREIAKELSGEDADVEKSLNKPDGYPVRFDFCITGGIQEALIAPLGLLQSHLKYWSDRDTCYFMLKMITQFFPRISRERRDSIIAEARKTRDAVQRIMQRYAK